LQEELPLQHSSKMFNILVQGNGGCTGQIVAGHYGCGTKIGLDALNHHRNLSTENEGKFKLNNGHL